MKYPSSKSRSKEHLYPKRGLLIVLLALAISSTLLHAQSKKPSGPRGIAVVTWNGPSSTPPAQSSVLTPIAIYTDGRFYDANLYEAQPQPMALDGGVIYDVLRNGDLIGTFTVGGLREKDDIWYGTGLFEPKGAMTVQMTKSGPRTTRSGQTASASSNSGNADDRPKLRRGTPPPPAPKEQTDAVLNSIDQDPERPKLRRHSADEVKAEQSAAVKPPATFVPPETHILPAVSAVGGPEPHSFIERYKTGELTQIRESMEALVRAEVAKQSKKPEPAVKTTSKRTRPTPAAPPLELSHASFGAFDVNNDNAPVVIYSATVMIDGEKKYITVGAWEEIDESLRKVFEQITDDNHLDVYPRLEIIDAVDARGKDRGELLFRAFGDQGNRFVLYHPGPDSFDLLFDSARAESAR